MPEAPRATRRPTRLEAHGHVRVDDYYWLREREDPEVRAYLEAENAFTEACTSHTSGLRERLFEEIKGRIQQTDRSVPWRKRGWCYYTRYEDGLQYPLHCRRRDAEGAAEELLLDVNALAAGHSYCALGRRAVSPDTHLLAYAVDFVGRRFYTVRFKDLRTGEELPDVIERVTSNFTWASDSRTLLYTRQHPETLRWHRIHRHVLGAEGPDPLVYEEEDPTFSVHVFRSRSEQRLLIVSHATLSSEVWSVPADAPEEAPRLFHRREPGHECMVDHFDGRYFVLSNEGARNFRLCVAPEDARGRDDWEELVAHREDVLLETFELFDRCYVLHERRAGLVQLRIVPWSGVGEHCIDFGEATYSAWISANPEPESELLRFGFTSLTTPSSVYDYHTLKRTRVLLKRETVLGPFDPADYASERLEARAPDGERVPISLVYRRDRRKTGPQPLLLYAYGAYGSSTDASFSSSRLSLLDRGLIFAIAHVRGGEELGRRWYEQGRLEHKENTFSDFEACAAHLCETGYTAPEELVIWGGSAGGLLVGAVLNRRPELFAGAIASVPFVDVVTTMLDDSIPLTTGEYDEWGDPREEEAYRRLLSWSPYDNLAAQAYPALLVTAGLHDSQVQYWEPAKYVARLRTLKTDDRQLLLKTELEAGHGGVSGRYERYRELAFKYAFLLDVLGLTGE